MEIPLHNFSRDDETSIPFKIVPLRQQSDYDSGVPHRHNYYEIFFFEQGTGTHIIDFNTLTVNSHSIHFVSPGQVHHLRRSPDSYGSIILFSREFYYLGLQEKNLLFEMPFLNNAVVNPVLNLSKTEFAQCYRLLRAMEQEMEEGLSYSRHQLRSYLNILMVSCKRLFERKGARGEAPAASHPLFNRFRQVLEENFARHHQVQEYAPLLGVNERQLSEMVKSLTGSTVLEHIHSRLMLEARRLLRHSELSLKEISYHLHFEDPSHFSRFFKTRMGCSPGSYREREEEIYK